MNKINDDEKKILKHTYKSSLKEFTVEEARGWIIDRFMRIENKINWKIVDYINPGNKDGFERIMLNSSILDMGSKLKILKNAGTIDDKTIEKIRKLTSIRNGFAHAPTYETTMINVNIRTEDNFVETDVHVSDTMIDVMNSQGVLKKRIAFDYLVEFWKLEKEIRSEI